MPLGSSAAGVPGPGRACPGCTAMLPVGASPSPHTPRCATASRAQLSLLLPPQMGVWAPQAPDAVCCALVDLASVLTPEIMAPILANADVQERLLPYLPSGESLPQTAEEIQNTLTSPQFQQVTLAGARLAWGWHQAS